MEPTFFSADTGDSESCTVARESLDAVVAAEVAYGTTHGRYTFEISELDVTLPQRVIAIANAGTDEEIAITVSNPFGVLSSDLD